MNGQGAAAALLGPWVVLALLVIRTAVREMKEPGSARHEWTFLRERRGLVTFLATALVLSAVSWTISGPAYLSWVGLAALLVARVSSKER
ncbi:hypothetical protein [Streptomyces sp. NBC_01763]|uniref:hypothetical protein n=1 Tax=Streptomyces sp. NBC_01763 TaxID=2975934 RepID=UPI002DDC3A72|nr:hypothetical protein [Streptomyces sp. NBC_01763]WSC35570.1 hypothetical protein OHA08_08695 [Streptomyces sp. NBC_01763]